MEFQKHLPSSPSSFGAFRFVTGDDGSLLRIPTSSVERGFLLESKQGTGYAALRVRCEPISISGKVPPSELWTRVADREGQTLPSGFVSVCESGEDDGLPYYITGIHHGEPLREYIKRVGPLPAGEAFKLLADFVNVLDSQDVFCPEHLAIAIESVWIIQPSQEGLPPRLGLGEYLFLSTSEPEQKSVEGSCALLWSLLAGEWWDDRYPDPVRKLAERKVVSRLVVPADGSPLGWKDWRRQLENLAIESFGTPARPLPQVASFITSLLASSMPDDSECNVIARAVQEAPPREVRVKKRWSSGFAAGLAFLIAFCFVWKDSGFKNDSRAPFHETDAIEQIQGLLMQQTSLADLKLGVPAVPAITPNLFESVVNIKATELGLSESAYSTAEPGPAPIRFDIEEMANFGVSFDSFPRAGGDVDIKSSSPDDSSVVISVQRAKQILAGLSSGGDASTAVSLLEKAAGQRDAEAQYLLGEAYLMGRIVEKDQKLGVAQLRLSASQDFARAADMLGVCSMRGWGVPVDHEKAVIWFSKAVSLGHPGAHYNLGARYAQGQGVERDPEKAASLFERGAGLGDSVSMMLFGRCYESGFGIGKDEILAKYWHRKSALAGNNEAAQWCEKNGVSLASN